MSDEIILSWVDVNWYARLLASRLSNQKWQGIVAVARGGLVPAAIIASQLGLRVIDTVTIASYRDKQRDAVPVLLKSPVVPHQGAGWLIVDDLVDTGDTLSLVRELLPKAYVAVLYAKPKGMRLVDMYARSCAQHIWINFPWEEKDA